MANDPVPLLVPCHRVVGNDGTTGRYAFGMKEKVGLLEAEGVSVEELVGSPYLATPTTGIVCHATCRNARRIRPENRRPFRSRTARDSAIELLRITLPRTPLNKAQSRPVCDLLYGQRGSGAP